MESSRETQEGKVQKHMVAGPTGDMQRLGKTWQLLEKEHRTEGSGGLLWLAMPLEGATGVRRRWNTQHPQPTIPLPQTHYNN